MKKHIVVASIVAALGGASSVATAGAIFTDRAAFTAAVLGTVVDDYNCSGCGFLYLGTGSASRNGVNYVNFGGVGGNGANNFLIGTFYGPNALGDDFFQAESTGITINLGASVLAIGMDIGALFGQDTYTLTVGATSVQGSANPQTAGFVGILADTPFTTASLSITGTGNGIAIQIDDLTMASRVVNVPEPATLALVGLGIGALGLRRRRMPAN